MHKHLYFVAWLLATGLLMSCGQTARQTDTPDTAPEWRRVWSDEFNNSGAPDSSKWRYEEGYLRNHERQYYTRGRPENARVENGRLIIEARADSAVIDGAIRPVTSASLVTKGKAEWTYGRIEVRAKLPKGRGTWPAIWMLGSRIDSVGWPDCGEIDIMEHVGYAPGVIHTTIHTKAFNWMNGKQPTADTLIADCMDVFHVYAIHWDPEQIEFFIDSSRLLTFKNTHQGTDQWPFDTPHYLILNLAIGGDWGGQKGVDSSLFPAAMQVDYVRVYQRQ